MKFRIIDYPKLRKEAKPIPAPSFSVREMARILFTYKPARNKSDVFPENCK